MKKLQRQLSRFVVTLTGMWICFAAGCGGQLPDAVPTSGTVLYEGKPLEGATVTFRSEAQGEMAEGVLALGTTDSQGKFTLQSRVGPTDVVDGLVPGDYRVAISKFVPPKGMSETEYEAKRAEEARIMETEGFVPPNKQAPPKVELLAPEYSDTRKTTLKATIPKEGNESLEFDLK